LETKSLIRGTVADNADCGGLEMAPHVNRVIPAGWSSRVAQRWTLCRTWIGLDWTRTMTNFVEFGLDPDCKLLYDHIWAELMENNCVICCY